MIEFGSLEWFQKAKEVYKFPQTVAIYLSSEHRINALIVDTKSEHIGNIQYKKITPEVCMFDGSKLALLHVGRFENVDEYYNVVIKLRSDWGIE